MVRSWKATREKRWLQMRCPGKSETLSTLAEDSRKHDLALFTCQGVPGLVCTTCGAHSSFKLCYLARTCPRRPMSRTLAEARARFAKGQHPHHRRPRLLDNWCRLPEYVEEYAD